MLILVAALVGCGYNIHEFVDLYFKYPITVNLQVQQRKSVDFPAVTICNLNRIKLKYKDCVVDPSNSRMCPNTGESRIGFHMSELHAFRICSKQFREQQKQDDAVIQFLKKYSELEVGYRKHFSYSSKELILNCSFNGKSCNRYPFKKTANIRYGNCFIFNKFSMSSKGAALVASTGSSNGLELILNAEADTYLPISHTLGMRVVIHHPSEGPNPEEDGMNIVPGYETHISLQQTEILRLPAPYKDKCIAYEEKKSQKECMVTCLQRHNYAKCGCLDPLFKGMNGIALCNLTNSTQVCCLHHVTHQLNNNIGKDCECSDPCISSNYKVIKSISFWPSKASFSQTYEKFNHESLDKYRKSHAKVHIFFPSLEKTVYQQKPFFLESEIYSNLGGELGLWLGLSLIALFEIVEMMLFYANRIICNHT
ncbi:Degenerin mec-10 [Araneus ventricosus]|uniref:Degenerin mec-10 n=1 Tax=Araneus ventricosus TaxID=182803 RepID=A0A4Y2ASX7_ARAVE|nr:Degenerin mec-10 [Araneus ventricosus]